MKNTQLQKSFHILLIGDSCVDRYVYGSVKRISPEAPIPILAIEREESKPGMTLNVEANLKNLGCTVEVITNTQTITKTRFIDSRGYQLLRTDDEPELDPWDMRLPKISNIDAVVISDYNKGFLSYNAIEHIIKSFKGPVFIDTKKQDLARFEGAYVKVNRDECELAKSYNSNLIVTLGRDGAGYKGKIFPTQNIELTDVCGAGDTFLASLCYQFLKINDIEKAIKFANIAASITVQHLGNYAPSLNEMLDNYYE
jgi:D-beta-D-heptose 7-phosphate kinase/D-beta-D-heptose 1-phosphate adenosyltransferase